MQPEILLIIHDVRSCHNVGSLLRTAEGVGIKKVIFSGLTPYPILPNDSRLPHISNKLASQISKTALGAEKLLELEHIEDLASLVKQLQAKGYQLVGLEQSVTSVRLNKFQPPAKIALVVGNEVNGLSDADQKLMDTIVEIPMLGQKESFNVVQSAAMALYHCRFLSEYAIK